MASIRIIQGPDTGRTFEVRTDGLIGRGNGAVPLTDSTVSRQHARFNRENGVWRLEDLGSANGTYVNGVRVSRSATLKGGDQVRCGSTLLVFSGGEPASGVEVDENGQIVDAAIVATVPSNEDSVIIPTPEAGVEAIGNLRILYGLIQDVGSVFDVDALLEQTLTKVFEIVKADRGYIMLFDEEGELTLRCSRVQAEGIAEEVPISRTIINEVVRKQVGAISSNAMSDKRFAAGKSVHNFGIRSAICVPIKGREEVLGVIHVDCSVSEHTYTTEQLRLLTAIGYQTGLAVENVRLYESAVQSERLAAVGETVARLSHHIKNILQALSAGLEIVEAGVRREDLDRIRSAWPIVQRNIERTHSLILNMLAFSKEREPVKESINVNHVLTECVDLVRPRADERGVAVLTDLDDMPPIPADPSGLQQAFMNLLTNAVEAVEDRSGAVTVSSEYDTMERSVRVRVADNGSGIDEESIESIWTPFYSSKGQAGTGLGLAVTRKIIDEHHGRIEVESEPGQGTAFILHIPAIEGVALDASDTRGPGR